MNFEERIYKASPGWLRTVFLNLHALRIARHRYGKPYALATQRLQGLEHASREVIERDQLLKLRRVVGLAQQRSPFYREYWRDVPVEARELREISDLRHFPILTKDALRSAANALLTEASTPSDWLHGHTSGTTGSPLSLWYSREMCIENNAADRLQKLWAGVGERDWIGMFLGRTVTPISQSSPPFWRRNYVHHQQWFSSFHLSDSTAELYVAEIARRRIRYLEGYPSTLFMLAQYLRRAGKRLPMKAVFSSSETLLEVQRTEIQDAFQAPLYDFYGHAERTAFAIECGQHQGKHLVEPYGIAEIVDASGQPVPDGTVGYLVSTSLHNTAMPLIRYRTTDLTAIESGMCECGRTWRKIRDIATKAEDIIVLPDGRWISPSILTHPFKPYPQIRKSQIIQESLDHIRIRLVASNEFSAELERELLAGVSERIGPAVRLTLERVEDIQREPSGKYRWVISRVPHELRVNWKS